MRLVVLDSETFFDRKTYTLSRMSTEAYIRDARFEAHGAAIKWSADTPARWYNEPQLRWVLQNEDWSDTFLVAHHTQFDGLILSFRYGVHPRRLGCTLSMARLMLGNHLSVSLDSVRKHFGIPLKSTPYQQMDGKHWHEMSQAVQDEVARGAEDEVESVWTIFHLLMSQGFPSEELKVIDTTLKMFTEPVLRGDIDLLASVWETENQRKQDILVELNVTAAELQSAEKFAGLLRAEGIEPEMKDGKNEPIYAFAKTDEFMRNLLEDESPRVRALAEARLDQKSTLMQTRAETLGWMARRGSMPVYLRYCGAHTTRWSGGDSCNWQNFKRGSDIRRAILAPDGFLLLAIDLKAIEWVLCRYLAGEHSFLDMFRNGEDPYCPVASQFYGYTVTKDTHPRERQAGKVIELQAQYGSGGEKIRITLRNNGIVISPEQGEQAKNTYRSLHIGTVNYWREADTTLVAIGGNRPMGWGPFTVKNKKLYLPTGIHINYETLEWYDDRDSGDRYWRLRTRHGWSKMYGAKLVENAVQFAARVVLSQAMVRIADLGYKIANTTHDELLILIPKDGHEEKHAKRCAAEMKIAPDWLPNLPLDVEYSLAERYSK